MGIADSIQMGIIQKQAEFFFGRKQFKSALKKYLYLLELSIKKELPLKQAVYHRRAADCYEKLEHHKTEDMMKDHQNAGEHYVRSAEIYASLGKIGVAAEVYERGAYSFEEINKYDEAARFYAMSAQMFRDIGDYYNASYTYQTASKYYDQGKNYEMSAITNIKAATLALKVKDKSNASQSFKRAAKAYEREKKWQKAVDAYASAVELDSLMNKYLEVADNYEKMARCYDALEKQDESIYYFVKSGELRRRGGDDVAAATSFMEAGEKNEARQQYADAKKQYEYAEKIYLKEGKAQQAAETQKKLARVCTHLGDLFSAAKFNLAAADSYASADMRRESNQEYIEAANSFIDFAKDNIEHGVLEIAAEGHMNAGYCYEKISKFTKAAEQYTNYARIAEDVEGLDEREGYKKAAWMYAEAGHKYQAGLAFQTYEAYEESVKVLTEYAQEKEEKKDMYEAARGYLEAGQSYSRMEEDSKSKTSFDKAHSRLQKYLEERPNRGKLEGQQVLDIAFVYLMLGRCNLGLRDSRNAETHFRKSLELYERGGDEDGILHAKAFYKEVDAERAIDHGYYEKATSLLKEAIELFKGLLEKAWPREYERYLEDHRQKCHGLLRKIELKPEIGLAVDQRSFTFTDIPLILNVFIENKGVHGLKEVSFLEHLPDSIKLIRIPDAIKEIAPAEKRRASIELNPTNPGFYRIQPIEVYFEDEDGNKYVKASNEVSVEVVDRPPTDYKNYMKAVETFVKYAENQADNLNYFQAGDGYREAAQVYGKFNSDSRLADYYLKAVDNYQEYVKEYAGDVDSEDPTKVKRVADAYWWSGESNRLSDRMQHARDDYEMAAKIYERGRVTNRQEVAWAFHNIIKGRIYAKHGQYENASESLSAGLENIDSAVKEGGFSQDYVQYLEKFEDEARMVLKQVRERPEIRITVDAPGEVRAGSAAEFKVLIENPLEKEIVEIRPVLKKPEGFQVVRKPDTFAKVGGGEKVETSFIMLPKAAGDYSFKPLDVSFTTVEGKNYVQGSDTISGSVDEPLPGQAVEDVEIKPQVEIEVDSTSKTFTDLELILNVRVTNKSDVPLTELVFLANLPEGLTAGELPERIGRMAPGDSVEDMLEINPLKPGEYHVKPVEVYYLDPAGDKYVSTSNESGIKVMKRPSEDYDMHSKAVETYVEYALTQEKNRNFYLAGIGYMEAARVYGKFNSGETLVEYRKNAVKHLKAFVGETRHMKEEASGIQRRLGYSHWHLGELYFSLNILGEAQEHYRLAQETFSKTKAENWMEVAAAFGLKAKAKSQIDTGNLAQGKKTLEESLAHFKNAFSIGGFSPRFLEYLEKNESESRLQITSTEKAPDFAVKVSSPGKKRVGEEVVLEVSYVNNTEKNVSRVVTYPNVVGGISLVRTPTEVDIIGPGREERVSLVIRAEKPGIYDFKPVDVGYRVGEESHKVGSNTVSILIEDGFDSEKTVRVRPEVREVSATPAKVRETGQKISSRSGGGELTVMIGNPPSIPRGEPVEFELRLVNKSGGSLRGIRLIPNAPKGLKIARIMPQEFREIEAGGEQAAKITVESDAEGEYRSSLIEFFYRDEQGNRYFGEPDEAVIQAGDKMESVKPGETYILAGEDVKKKRERIMQFAGERRVLLISGENPARIKVLRDTDMNIWLSDVGTFEETISPAALTSISMEIDGRLKEGGSYLLFIEDFSHLVEHNDFNTLIDFIHYMKDLVTKRDTIFVIGVDSTRMEPLQFNKIKAEGEQIK